MASHLRSKNCIPGIYDHLMSLGAAGDTKAAGTAAEVNETTGGTSGSKRKAAQSSIKIDDNNRKTPGKRHATKQEAEDNLLASMAMFAADLGIAFSAFDRPSFRNMAERIATSSKSRGKSYFSAQSVRAEVVDLSGKGRILLKERIKGRKVIPTTDHWTSKALQNYSSLTLHWIDGDGVLRGCVVSVYAYHGTTKAPNLVKNFMDKLAEWEIETENVPYVVVSNYKLCIGRLFVP